MMISKHFGPPFFLFTVLLGVLERLLSSALGDIVLDKRKGLGHGFVFGSDGVFSIFLLLGKIRIFEVIMPSFASLYKIQIASLLTAAGSERSYLHFI